MLARALIGSVLERAASPYIPEEAEVAEPPSPGYIPEELVEDDAALVQMVQPPASPIRPPCSPDTAPEDEEAPRFSKKRRTRRGGHGWTKRSKSKRAIVEKNSM